MSGDGLWAGGQAEDPPQPGGAAGRYPRVREDRRAPRPHPPRHSAPGLQGEERGPAPHLALPALPGATPEELPETPCGGGGPGGRGGQQQVPIQRAGGEVLPSEGQPQEYCRLCSHRDRSTGIFYYFQINGVAAPGLSTTDFFGEKHRRQTKKLKRWWIGLKTLHGWVKLV